MDGFDFSVSVYGKMEKYNDVLSKARCRIFYKYENRNGTYITDEFANELLSSVAYAPIKGIYDFKDGDYEDHGEERSEGRIYGIVPENPNVSWEKFLDEDGVEREYACVDVLIFTALYKEAYEIVGKSQSMEIYAPSIKYHKETFNGQSYIVFDKGCFLGLQVLGDDVEPCFEGAAFFELQDNIKKVVEQIKSIYSNEGDKNDMSKINFKLSDDQKFQALWNLLNTEYNEEKGWIVSYSICDIYDDYAIAYNYENCEYERIYYVKNDETNTVEISEKKKCFIIDVSENELNTIETLRTLNGGTYDIVDEDLANAKDYAQKISESNLKIEELGIEISTLNTEKETAQASINSLTEENNSLKEFKLSIENAEKENIINEYSAQLSEDIIDNYKEKINDFSAEELDKELAYEFKKANASVFKKSIEGIVPKEIHTSGVEAILASYVK